MATAIVRLAYCSGSRFPRAVARYMRFSIIFGTSCSNVSGRRSKNHLIRFMAHVNSRSDSEPVQWTDRSSLEAEDTRAPGGEILRGVVSRHSDELFFCGVWSSLPLFAVMKGAGSNLGRVCVVSATIGVHHPSFPAFRFWNPASRPHLSPAVLARSAMIFGAIHFCTVALSEQVMGLVTKKRIWQFPLLVSTTTAAYFWLMRSAVSLVTSSRNSQGCSICGCGLTYIWAD